MTKQEIIDAIKSKCIPIYDDVVGYDFDWIADTLLAKIEQEKKDTLKEFVEQYTNVLIKDYNNKAWMMNHAEEQEIEDRWFYRGQCTAIQRLIVLLDSDLEKFLEERK